MYEEIIFENRFSKNWRLYDYVVYKIIFRRKSGMIDESWCFNEVDFVKVYLELVKKGIEILEVDKIDNGFRKLSDEEILEMLWDER